MNWYGPYNGTYFSKLIKEVIAKKLSVRSVEAAVNKRGNKPKNIQRQDNDTIRLKNELSEILGAEVSINHNQSGKGKITISYKSLICLFI